MLSPNWTSLLLIPEDPVAVNQAFSLMPRAISIRSRNLEQVLSDHSRQDSMNLSRDWRRAQMSPTTVLVMHLNVNENEFFC
jgi:hypothetical protein